MLQKQSRWLRLIQHLWLPRVCIYDQIWETIYSNINLYQVQQEEITNTPFCSTHHLCVDLRNLLW